MNSANKRAFWLLLLALGLLAGCARTVELKHGEISTGERYRLVYIKSRVPVDVGDLWLKVSRQETEIVSKRLEAGYDLYTDIEATVVETPPGNLVIVEKRAKKAWTVDPEAREVRKMPYAEALSLAAKK